MDLAVDNVAELNAEFAKFKYAKEDAWRKRKYDSLYSMTKSYTQKYVGTDAGEELRWVPDLPQTEE